MNANGPEQRWPAALLGRVRQASVVLMVLIGLGVFWYAFLRAERLSFTHDESLSYLSFVGLEWGDLLSHKVANTNNHMLNTLGMKAAAVLFGPGELALRVPNLLALVIYMVFAALLVRPLGVLPGLFTWVCLCAAYNFLEAFSLARGYGLSFAFILMAQYHLNRSLSVGGAAPVIWTHVGLVLAILSSFVVVTFAMASVIVMCAVHAIVAIRNKGRRGPRWTGLLTSFLMVPLLVFAVWEPLRRTLAQNKLDFGGSEGFVRDTFRSLMHCALPAIKLDDTMIMALFVAFILLALYVAFVACRWLMKEDGSAARMPTDLLSGGGVLLVTCIIIVVQHAVLGTQYPVSRFCRFLYPLLVLGMGSALAIGARERRLYWPITLLMGWAAFVSVRTLVRRAEFVTTSEWTYDTDTRTIMRSIIASMDEHRTDSVRIGNPWILEPTMNFYRTIYGADLLMPARHEGPVYDEDYLILADSMLSRFDPAGYQRMGRYPDAGLYVYRSIPTDGREQRVDSTAAAPRPSEGGPAPVVP